MTREEIIHELGEWLEQMVQHGVQSHSAKRKALATAIVLLSAEAADVYKAHEEEHLEIINRIKELQYAIAKTQTIVGKVVESADAGCEDTQTEEQARFVAKETELAHIEAKLGNAEKRLQYACTANFVAEQLDRLRKMTDEERWDFFIRFFSPSAEAEWIPCSDGLPKAEYGESDCVLTTCCWKSDTKKRWIEKLYYNGGYWCYPTGECFTHKVIAWKPMPDPYREDGE